MTGWWPRTLALWLAAAAGGFLVGYAIGALT